jgi:MFS family permease
VKGAALGRPFWLIWAAASVSYAGDGLVAGALPLLAASLTRDPRLVAAVEALGTAGWLLLGLVSGVVVDRVDRLGLMWRVDVIRAVVFGLFGGLVLTGHTTIGLLFGVSFLLGLASPFFDNASSSVLPELVPEAELERANSVTQTSQVVLSNLIGPPVGAVLFVVSTGAPFVVDAVSFAVAALLVARGVAMRRARSGIGVTAGMVAETAPSPTRQGVSAALREGIGYLRSHRVLGVLAVAVGVINMVVGGIMAILVLYVLEVLGLSQTAYGWLISTFGVGGVLASVATPLLVRWLGPAGVTNASVVTFGVSVLALGLTSNLAVVVLALVVGGFAGLSWNVVTISYRQRIVPRALLGRVTSVYRMAAFIAMPVGAIGAGWLGHAIGIQRTYLVGGLVLLVTSAVAFRRIREMSATVAT